MAYSKDVIIPGDQNFANNKCSKDEDTKQEHKVISVDFDDILPHVGEMGRYQLGLYLLLCIPATIPTAFLGSSLFISNAKTLVSRASFI